MDSLVDIVSNNVGILLLLAVFIALLLAGAGETQTLNRAGNREPPQQKPSANLDQHTAQENTPLQPTYRQLKVPWSHATEKRLVFFNIEQNRVFHFELSPFYEWLAKQKPKPAPTPLTFSKNGLTIRFYPVTSHVHCLEFIPDRKAGERWHSAQFAQSAWRSALERYPQARFVWFFWVHPENFALFRIVRNTLWDKGYEVSWRPHLADQSLQYCNSFEGTLAFRPQ